MSGVNSLNTSYDAIGNPLSYRDGLTFTWKNGRQLATLSKTGTSASYKYDDSGVRTSKTVNGVTTNYYRAGNLAVGEISTERGLEYILDANGGIYGIYYRSLKSGLQCGDTYYFAYNAQGDVIGLYTYQGDLVASYSYDEWGNCTVTALMPDTQNHAVTDVHALDMAALRLQTALEEKRSLEAQTKDINRLLQDSFCVYTR